PVLELTSTENERANVLDGLFRTWATEPNEMVFIPRPAVTTESPFVAQVPCEAEPRDSWQEPKTRPPTSRLSAQDLELAASRHVARVDVNDTNGMLWGCFHDSDWSQERFAFAVLGIVGLSGWGHWLVLSEEADDRPPLQSRM